MTTLAIVLGVYAVGGVIFYLTVLDKLVKYFPHEDIGSHQRTRLLALTPFWLGAVILFSLGTLFPAFGRFVEHFIETGRFR